ncbi:hypothetical protein L1887_10380 [Cichorium endivia]|nr:hypothetical protein L1887_10380 [Cichorium endivia]
MGLFYMVSNLYDFVSYHKAKAFSCFLRRLIFRIRFWIELTAGLLRWMPPTIMMHHQSSLKVAYLQRLLLMVIQFQILKAR